MDFRAMPITVSSFFMHHHDHHQGTRVFNKLYCAQAALGATCWPQIADQRGPHWKLSRNHHRAINRSDLDRQIEPNGERPSETGVQGTQMVMMGWKWGNDGTTMGRRWRNDGVTMARRWHDNGMTMGRQWGDDVATIGRQWGEFWWNKSKTITCPQDF